MPLLPSALPPKGEARHYVANDFLNLIALPYGGKVVPKAPKGVHFHERSEVVWFSKCQRYTVII